MSFLSGTNPSDMNCSRYPISRHTYPSCLRIAARTFFAVCFLHLANARYSFRACLLQRLDRGNQLEEIANRINNLIAWHDSEDLILLQLLSTQTGSHCLINVCFIVYKIFEVVCCILIIQPQFKPPQKILWFTTRLDTNVRKIPNFPLIIAGDNQIVTHSAP